MIRSLSWSLPFTLFIKAKQGASIVRRANRKLFGAQARQSNASVPRTINKIIWIYWDKGEEDAPQLVQDCIASWRHQNPGWDVRVIDKSTLSEALNLPELPRDIPVQAFSDLLRLRLLNENGGVWADATAFCMRPLDHWLPALSQSGFFAFSWTENDQWFLWPGITREIGSWFLASEKGGAVISEWEQRSFEYWANREKTDMYFWVHMIFDYLARTSRSFRRSQRITPKVSCFSAHLIYDCVLRDVYDTQVVTALRAGAAPVQKLRWNWEPEQMQLAIRLLRASGVEGVRDLEPDTLPTEPAWAKGNKAAAARTASSYDVELDDVELDAI